MTLQSLAALSSLQLFGPAQHLQHPGIAWDPARFKQVDDSVRGGSSRSNVVLVDHGRLKFSGYLDATTLGGAGFASQQYVPATDQSQTQSHLPPQPDSAFPIVLHEKDFQGLELHIVDSSRAQRGHSSDEKDTRQAGEGKGLVSTFVLNLYTNEQKRRPDGRLESRLAYEWTFTPLPELQPHPSASSSSALVVLRSEWSDFNATYRGRPQPEAPPLVPEKIKNWSLMARSDFGKQSGEFCLVVDSMWAVRRSDNNLASHNKSASTGGGSEKRGLALPYHRPRTATQATMSGAHGFALYVFSTFLLFAWVLWALLPDRWLRAAGITWYPSRQWAFLMPAWSMILVLFIYVAYLGINLAMTPPLEDVSTLTDAQAKLPFAVSSQKDGDIPRAQKMSWHEARNFYLELVEKQSRQQHKNSEDARNSMPDIYDAAPAAALDRFQRL